MDVISVATKIENKIKLLEIGRALIKERGIKKATLKGTYEKAIAITIMKLKNDVAFELEGVTVKSPAATVSEKIAKGICYQECIDLEIADSNYKAAIVGMSAIQAELNGYQSIFRYLDEPTTK